MISNKQNESPKTSTGLGNLTNTAYTISKKEKSSTNSENNYSLTYFKKKLTT